MRVNLPPRVVILAAGASERLGEPKALAKLGERAALAHLLEACGEPSALVITGAHSKEIAAAFQDEAELIEHSGWKAGRTSSIACAVAHSPDRDILLAPVDSPLVPQRVFQLLRETWSAAGAPSLGWLSPKEESAGRYGHPIIIGRELSAKICELKVGDPLRCLRDLAEPLLELSVECPEVLDNMDTPEDLARIRARL